MAQKPRPRMLVAKIDESVVRPMPRRTPRPIQKARVAITDGADCQTLQRQAQALMDSGETEKAAELLKRALQNEPGKPCIRTMTVRLALCRAHSAIRCNYLECAARRLREVLYLEPNNRVAQRLLNDVYNASGIDPNNPDQRQHLAQCLANNGRHVAAMVEYREASKLHKSVATYVGLANAALKMDHKSVALSELRKAIALAPYDPAIWQQIGFLEESRGRLDAAAAAFTQSAALNARNPISIEKALQTATQAVQRDPRNIDRQLDLARAYLLSDQSDRAASVYNQIAREQPNVPQYSDWLTLEQENISLKRAAYAHSQSPDQLASNDVQRFLMEGPRPETGSVQIDEATAKLKGGCNCD